MSDLELSSDDVGKSKLTRGMEVSSAPEAELAKKNTVDIPDEPVRLESLIQLLDAEYDFNTFSLSFAINLIKGLVYVSLLANIGSENQASSNSSSFVSILIVLVFAALSMTATGFDTFHILMVALGTTLETLFKKGFSPARALLLFLEGSNFFLLFLTAVFIVPGQGSPLDIVLNCTALTTVSNLDDAYLKCFTFTYVKNKRFARHADLVKKSTSNIFVGFFGLAFFGTFFILLVLFILYRYTATNEIGTN